jgi:GAF domain
MNRNFASTGWGARRGRGRLGPWTGSKRGNNPSNCRECFHLVIAQTVGNSGMIDLCQLAWRGPDYLAEILFVGSRVVVSTAKRWRISGTGCVQYHRRRWAGQPETLRTQRRRRPSLTDDQSFFWPIWREKISHSLSIQVLMDTQDNRRLAEVLGNLAVEMQSQHSSESVLRAIVAGAIDVVPGTSCAGISRVSGRRVSSEMPSDAIAAELDQLQTELNEGPALSALRERRTVFIKNMSEETRWPNFVAAATPLGVHCMLSFRLFVIGGSLGALNLYGAAPEA